LGAALEYFRDLSEEQVSGVDITNGGSGCFYLSALRWHNLDHGFVPFGLFRSEKGAATSKRGSIDAITEVAASLPGRKRAWRTTRLRTERDLAAPIVGTANAARPRRIGENECADPNVNGKSGGPVERATGTAELRAV
jgi:hypothetical protein